ncbi:Serine/threonine-protein kinase [Ceratobasidium sp. AG-Ba]|nr:Serine/threonine-protein kinase [Ceratobasidium sp. AG-Ba]
MAGLGFARTQLRSRLAPSNLGFIAGKTPYVGYKSYTKAVRNRITSSSKVKRVRRRVEKSLSQGYTSAFEASDEDPIVPQSVDAESSDRALARLWDIVRSRRDHNRLEALSERSIPRRGRSIPQKPKIDMPKVVSSAMSVSEIVALFSDSHCTDISRELDQQTCSKKPVLGGGFGDIYHGKLRSGDIVAIKCPRLFLDNSEQSREVLKNVARELYAWSKCDHRYITQLLGVARFRGQLAMVSPWLAHGALPQYIAQNPEVDRLRLCRQISAAVDYLHNVGIIHGDIKGANILISHAGDAKLTDFGNSILKSSTIQFTGEMSRDLSLRWAAPELIEGSIRSSKEADIYALAMTILETITGNVPYAGRDDCKVMFTVVIKREPPPRPDNMTTELWILLGRCWKVEPMDRPTAREVLDSETTTYDYFSWGLLKGFVLLAFLHHDSIPTETIILLGNRTYKHTTMTQVRGKINHNSNSNVSINDNSAALVKHDAKISENISELAISSSVIDVPKQVQLLISEKLVFDMDVELVNMFAVLKLELNIMVQLEVIDPIPLPESTIAEVEATFEVLRLLVSNPKAAYKLDIKKLVTALLMAIEYGNPFLRKHMIDAITNREHELPPTTRIQLSLQHGVHQFVRSAVHELGTRHELISFEDEKLLGPLLGTIKHMRKEPVIRVRRLKHLTMYFCLAPGLRKLLESVIDNLEVPLSGMASLDLQWLLPYMFGATSCMMCIRLARKYGVSFMKYSTWLDLLIGCIYVYAMLSGLQTVQAISLFVFYGVKLCVGWLLSRVFWPSLRYVVPVLSFTILGGFSLEVAYFHGPQCCKDFVVMGLLGVERGSVKGKTRTAKGAKAD